MTRKQMDTRQQTTKKETNEIIEKIEFFYDFTSICGRFRVFFVL